MTSPPTSGASSIFGQIVAHASERAGRSCSVAFGAADAMYAPVVSRFHTYAVDVGPVAREYMNAMMALPAWVEWRAAAIKEPWVLPEDEVDWPTVLRE